METGDLATWFDAVGGIGAAVAGVAAWRSAREVTRIERGRDHIELTPRFEVECRVPGTSGDDQRRATLRVTLVGPAGLDQLDRLTVVVRDDRIRTATPFGPTPEQVAGQIWGLYRFRRGVDRNAADGRHSGPYALPLGESLILGMDATLKPEWATGWTDDDWRQQFAAQPLRITLQCERDGHRPWIVPREVAIDRPSEPSVYLV